MHDRPRPAPIERLVQSPTIRSGYASALAHILIATILALLLLDDRPTTRRPALIIDTAVPSPDDGLSGEPEAAAAARPIDLQGDGLDAAADPVAPEPIITAISMPAIPTSDGPSLVMPSLADVAALIAPPRSSSTPEEAGAAGTPAAGGRDAFADRRDGARGRLFAERGGTPTSEAAVERGLAWLALHQAVDGSWQFDLSGCRCDGACGNRGTVTSTTAATGLALLPFLGAGHTHLEGRYRESVNRGLYYLLSRIQPTERGGDLSEGTMYGHGVATLALAEALGMSRDETLEKPLAEAVRFIVTSQDLYGGGWRYLPGQPGDTTVTAWQFAALKSASLAGVAVPSPTIDGVSRFLDRVQTKDGDLYGYLAPAARPCTSAIGLFCRLHLGWERRDSIDRGLATLAHPGPHPAQVYRNFYLAQALLQAEHPAWPRWNARNRDQLVSTQATKGHETGSWFMTEPDSAPGGRLAHTALAVLTLEVYYRILPLYREDAMAVGW